MGINVNGAATSAQALWSYQVENSRWAVRKLTDTIGLDGYRGGVDWNLTQNKLTKAINTTLGLTGQSIDIKNEKQVEKFAAAYHLTVDQAKRFLLQADMKRLKGPGWIMSYSGGDGNGTVQTWEVAKLFMNLDQADSNNGDCFDGKIKASTIEKLFPDTSAAKPPEEKKEVAKPPRRTGGGTTKTKEEVTTETETEEETTAETETDTDAEEKTGNTSFLSKVRVPLAIGLLAGGAYLFLNERKKQKQFGMQQQQQQQQIGFGGQFQQQQQQQPFGPFMPQGAVPGPSNQNMFNGLMA